MGNSDFASRSLGHRSGWDGHNMLGLTDLWDLEGSSDEELHDTLEVDAPIQQHLLVYLLTFDPIRLEHPRRHLFCRRLL